MANERYTKDIDETGWLAILLEGGSRVTVPEFVKVELTTGKVDPRTGKPADDRVYFDVLEGRYKGKKASLKKENAAKCLVDVRRGNGATLTVEITGRKKEYSQVRGETRNQLFAKLSCPGVPGAIISLDSDVDFTDPVDGKPKHSKPLAKGTYQIFTPQEAHDRDMTGFYRTSPGGFAGLKYDTVWFQIRNPATSNSNYVHVGNLSEGCITVYELKWWNAIYKYLISNRSDKDGTYVGSVTIK
jgi:hypothetical protein